MELAGGILTPPINMGIDVVYRDKFTYYWRRIVCHILIIQHCMNFAKDKKS